MFERKGCIVVEGKEKEKIELEAIEAGAEDIKETKSFIEIYTKADELDQVKKKLEEKGVKIESASLDWVPKEEIEANKESAEKLFEALDDNDAVQNVYSNIKL